MTNIIIKNSKEVSKLAKECNKYFENKSKDSKLTLDYDEFYAWVKYGYACGVNSK